MRILPAGIRRWAVLGLALLVTGLASAVTVELALAAGCPITGPTTVSVNESFTLCASQGSYMYEWHGPGLPASSTSRCMTVNGMSAGSYEYQLIVRSAGVVRERCRYTVRVGDGGFGSLTCAISGPTSIAAGASAELCAPQSSLHTYRWSGPGGFTASTPCITVSQAGTYDLSIVNTLTSYTRDCSHTLEVVGAAGADCGIMGPDVISVGSSVRLCAPPAGNVLYRWDGPNNFTSSSQCITARTAGTYYLSIRNRSTGAEQQCSHRLDPAEGTTEACSITGPASVTAGGTADLCAQSYVSSTYSWSGPGGFRSSQRCIRVSVAGVYQLAVRDRSTGEVRECSYTLESDSGPDDADALTSDNCPRTLGFWQRQCIRATSARQVTPNDFTLDEMRAIARCIDEGSTYFNWSDDITGFCAALNPPRPLTNQKQAARNYAALMANICAGELGITTRNGDTVTLDPDTPGSFGPVNTIGELSALADRMLVGRRGSFAQLSQRLTAVNRGRGIGPVCQ